MQNYDLIILINTIDIDTSKYSPVAKVNSFSSFTYIYVKYWQMQRDWFYGEQKICMLYLFVICIV